MTFALAASFLVSCQNEDKGSSASLDSGTSFGEARPEPVSILKKFSAKNGMANIQFKFIANSGSTTTPTMLISYIEQGYLVRFTAGWDSGRTNYGYVNVPSSKGAEGVYKYTLDSSSALVLGDKVTISAATDVYSIFYTPKYLFDNADTLGPLFKATAKSETNELTDSTYLVPVAKALGCYGFLTESIQGITISSISLTYSASSTIFTYAVYVNYKGETYLGARVLLNAFGTAKVPAITTYLGA